MDCDPERIWKIVENHRQNVQKRRRQPGSAMSLFDHLHDCYVECTQNSADKSSDKRFRSAVNLLQRVPPEHARPSLIVNLRSDEEGYSFMLCPSDGECQPPTVSIPHTHKHNPFKLVTNKTGLIASYFMKPYEMKMSKCVP